MTNRRNWIAFGMLVIGGVLALAQDGPRPPRERPQQDGFWPTPKMRDFFVNRITDEMAKVYNFDGDQVLTMRDVIKSRFPQWMDEHRDELQPLMNYWFETMISDEPPSPEEVAEWAGRITPLFEEVSEMVDATAEDMRGFLSEEQQVILDGQLAAMQVGMNYFRNRLGVWSDGGYDPVSEWPRGAEFQRRERERQEQLERQAEQAKNEAMGVSTPPAESAAGGAAPPAAPAGTERTESAKGPTRPAAAKKDEWDAYVDDFIKRYQLDADQSASARRYLADQRELRDKHIRRNVDKINDLDQRLKAATTEEERKKISGEIVEVNRPVERYFQRLKERLDTLPTRKQRSAAVQVDMQSRALEKGGEKKPKPAENQAENAEPKK